MNERRSLEYLALVALIVAFFGFYAVKVWDIDFWWHIAAGRNILENAAIPSIDPFGMYDAANACGQTVLKSEWLGQVSLYLVYHWFGTDGIILFRAGILALCLAIVYFRCRLASSASTFALVITALAGLAILHHTGERPQLFSFLFISLLFLLLDNFIRTGKRWMLYSILPLMLMWSNTHAGALMGVAALGLFGIGYTLENRWTEGHSNLSANKSILAVVGLSCIILVTAPSGFDTFKCIIFQQSGPVREMVSEYASPWSLWPATMYYWIFTGVTLVSLPGLLGRTYLKQGALICALALISMVGYRYIPFFVLVATPYVAASLSRILKRIKIPEVAAQVTVLLIALAFLGYGFKQEKVFQHGLQEHRFPVGAVSYIKEQGLSGKIFNTMNWGGYLLWNLPGTASLFIDGRTLDPYRVVPYTNVLWTTPEGLRFFEQANFNLVLVSPGNAFTGKRYPLIAYLKSQPDWKIVYRDGLGYLFAKHVR
jgi:energy-converting hydrogenase Eha subunit F